MNNPVYRMIHDLWTLLQEIITKFFVIKKHSYSHAPHNDVSVNDESHIRRWSHNFIVL